jgi:hypothetical protein
MEPLNIEGSYDIVVIGGGNTALGFFINAIK